MTAALKFSSILRSDEEHSAPDAVLGIGSFLFPLAALCKLLDPAVPISGGKG
jgi:hypothetical protein